jgi:GT2 family glycosyltransferase
MKVSIIIVNWNAGSQLAEVIASITKFHHSLVSSVIIIDNASTDDSLAQVEALKNLPFQLEVIRNQENRGFGAACNQGAALADSPYLLFLNPDTRIFESSLSVPLAFMEDGENQNVGIVGAQLMCAAQSIGLNRLLGLHHLNMHMTDWAHDKTRSVDHVIGAFYLMRRSIFVALDGFDERFFVYLEDLDLSLRAHQEGYQSVYLADAQAFHAGGGTSRQVKAHRLFYSLRSRLMYGFKHFHPWQAWSLVLITLSIEAFTRTGFSLMSDGIAGVRNTWSAYGMLWRELGSILDKGQQ